MALHKIKPGQKLANFLIENKNNQKMCMYKRIHTRMNVVVIVVTNAAFNIRLLTIEVRYQTLSAIMLPLQNLQNMSQKLNVLLKQQEMVEKKCLSLSHADSCMNLYNQATAKKVLLFLITSPIITYLCQYTLGESNYDKEENILNCDRCKQKIYCRERKGYLNI